MLTKFQVWKRLNEMGINKTLTEIDAALAQIDQQAVNKTLTEIDAALAQIDQQAVFSQERTRFKVEVWDKVTPINEVPAEKIIAREDVPDDGEIYLIYVDGKLLYLQPHNPFQAGLVAMTPDTVQQIANQHADQLAWQAADEKIFEMVLEKLLA